MSKLNSVSAVFPAYNDAGTIPSMVIMALKALPQVTDDYEVVVVNDGSQDYTGEVLAELASVYPRLRVITHPHNRGYGATLRTGFGQAGKEWIFYTDGDAQYDPHELVLLAQALRDDTDIVNGYKISRSDPLHRVIIGRLYHYMVKVVFGLPLRDTDCDFRLFRRSLFEPGRAGIRQWDDCPGAGEEVPRRRRPLRRSARTPLPPRLRSEPVLQLPPAVAYRRPAEPALVEAGGQGGPSARAGRRGRERRRHRRAAAS